MTPLCPICQIVKEADLKRVLSGKKKNAWEHPILRPWYRGQYGVVMTLRKLGRYKEALAAFDTLQDLDDKWYGSSSSYVNVLATLPECIYRWVIVGLHAFKCVHRRG